MVELMNLEWKQQDLLSTINLFIFSGQDFRSTGVITSIYILLVMSYIYNMGYISYVLLDFTQSWSFY